MKTKINDLKEEVLGAFNKEFGADFKHFDELPTLIGSDLGEVDNEAEIQEKLESFKSLWRSQLEEINLLRLKNETDSNSRYIF